MKRTENRQKSKEALITATLDSLAEMGLARTSVSEIVNRASLSRGMIHLHFTSKDKLIEAAAKNASDEYFNNLQSVLAQIGDSPQERLEAIILSDLSENVLNERSVRIWFALRGEASVSPAIVRYSDTRDKTLNDLVLDAFIEIAVDSNFAQPGPLARDATHGTLALLEGMWTDFFLHTNSFNRSTAQRIVFRFLSGLFPLHFTIEGAIRPSK